MITPQKNNAPFKRPPPFRRRTGRPAARHRATSAKPAQYFTERQERLVFYQIFPGDSKRLPASAFPLFRNGFCGIGNQNQVKIQGDGIRVHRFPGKILEAVLHPTKLIDNLLYTEGLLMTALSCELPVITASKSMTAIGKLLGQQPTPLRQSDMDLSLPIPVIGKVALSIHCRQSKLILKQDNFKCTVDQNIRQSVSFCLMFTRIKSNVSHHRCR